MTVSHTHHLLQTCCDRLYLSWGNFLNTDFQFRSSVGCFFLMLMYDLDILYPSWEQDHVICVCWACDVLSEAFAGVYNSWLTGDRNAIWVLAFSSKLDLHIKSLPENVGSCVIKTSRTLCTLRCYTMIGWHLNGCIIYTLHPAPILNMRMPKLDDTPSYYNNTHMVLYIIACCLTLVCLETSVWEREYVWKGLRPVVYFGQVGGGSEECAWGKVIIWTLSEKKKKSANVFIGRHSWSLSKLNSGTL